MSRIATGLPVPTQGAEGLRLPARLVYDTRFQPLPTGVRAVRQRTRRVMLVANEIEVTLQVSADSATNRVGVMGEVLLEGLPLADATIRVTGPDGLSDLGTDREGAFRLDDLPRGYYSFEIATPECVIEIRSLNLEEP